MCGAGYGRAPRAQQTPLGWPQNESTSRLTRLAYPISTIADRPRSSEEESRTYARSQCCMGVAGLIHSTTWFLVE
jgi:hypothetical protein